MKQGWEIKKLGEVGTFQRGGGFLKSDFVENGFPCIHYGQIHTRLGVKTYKHLTCITEELAFSKSKIAHSGDVIIAITSEDVEGSCKCTAWLGGYDVAVGAHAAIYRHNLNPAFVAYYFNGAHFNFEKIKYARGFKVVEIKPSDIEKISIKFPPREEQERIVEELDCLSGVIEKKREQLKELDALAQSIFYQMFGDPITNEKRWQVKKLGEVCNKITDGTHDTPERLSSGVKFITGKHIRAGIIDYDNSDYVLKEIHDEIYARCNPEYGDVLYTNIGANLGTAAINVVRYEFSMKNVALLKVKKDIINGYYLQSYLNDEEVKDDIINSLSNGGAQKFLSLKMIAKISIPLPPLALQQEFADKIEAIEKQKELIKKSIAETEELFNSRMDYYFN